MSLVSMAPHTAHPCLLQRCPFQWFIIVTFWLLIYSLEIYQGCLVTAVGSAANHHEMMLSKAAPKVLHCFGNETHSCLRARQMELTVLTAVVQLYTTSYLGRIRREIREYTAGVPGHPRQDSESGDHHACRTGACDLRCRLPSESDDYVPQERVICDCRSMKHMFVGDWSLIVTPLVGVPRAHP